MLNQCTVYTRNIDGTYTRQASRCHWQDQRGITYIQGEPVTMGNNTIFVMIPLELMDLPIVSAKDKSQNYIIKGIVDDEVTAANVGQKMQELHGLTIKAIDKNDYSIGVADNHWAVYAV